MIRWEYKIEKLPRRTVTRSIPAFLWGKPTTEEYSVICDMEDPEMVVWLNQLGADGWERIHSGYVSALFKRPVPDSPYRDMPSEPLLPNANH